MLRASLCSLQAALLGLWLLLLTAWQWAAGPLGSAALVLMARADHQHFLSRSCQLREILVMLSKVETLCSTRLLKPRRDESPDRGRMDALPGLSFQPAYRCCWTLASSILIQSLPAVVFESFTEGMGSWVYCSFSIPEWQLSWPEHGAFCWN